MPFNLLLLVWRDLVNFTNHKEPQPEIMISMIIRASYDDEVERNYVRRKIEKECKNKYHTKEMFTFIGHHLYRGQVASVCNEEEYLAWIKKND
jgi:hypothetical protein